MKVWHLSPHPNSLLLLNLSQFYRFFLPTPTMICILSLSSKGLEKCLCSCLCHVCRSHWRRFYLFFETFCRRYQVIVSQNITFYLKFVILNILPDVFLDLKSWSLYDSKDFFIVKDPKTQWRFRWEQLWWPSLLQMNLLLLLKALFLLPHLLYLSTIEP